jgi:hypothetical protein
VSVAADISLMPASPTPASIGVSMGPGAIAFTRAPKLANSRAVVRVAASIAPFAAV